MLSSLLNLKLVFACCFLLKIFLNVFFQAEDRIISQKMDKEYAGIIGIADFCSEAAKLAFSENSVVIKENLVR